MAKRGKTPSLIGGGAGASNFVIAKRKRACKRCGHTISGGNNCVEVSIPGNLGHKNYCIDCFIEVLDQTQLDINNLKEEVQGLSH